MKGNREEGRGRRMKKGRRMKRGGGWKGEEDGKRGWKGEEDGKGGMEEGCGMGEGTRGGSGEKTK